MSMSSARPTACSCFRFNLYLKVSLFIQPSRVAHENARVFGLSVGIFNLQSLKIVRRPVERKKRVTIVVRTFHH